MKKILLFSLCLILSSAVYAKITAKFTPNPVKQGDAVELVLSSDKSFSGVPNIDILQKDFVVGGQQNRHSAQWVNGKGQDIHQLIYTLFPNKSGDIVVRGLKVGNEVIPDLTLSVRADAKYETKGSIDLTVECQKTPVYPAQKMLCVVFMDDSIGLVDGEIIPPQSEQGTWEQILPPLPITSNKSGVNRYQSTFAFTPKDSGTFQMSPFVFQGSARLKTGERQAANIIDFMLISFQSSATQPVGAQSAPFSITVKAKPANYKGWWLPSPNVTLTESYQLPENIVVGEPITRTLTLTAQQVMADNMPVPNTPSTDKLKVYANPAERHDTPDGGQVVVTMTFVPTQSGEITLPAIQVPWFDSVHEKTEFASVPERKIFVTGEVAPQPQAPTPVVQPTTPTPQPEALPVSEPVQQSAPVQAPQSLPWLWIILALSLAFVLGIIVAVLIVKHTSSTERKKKKPLPDLYPF